MTMENEEKKSTIRLSIEEFMAQRENKNEKHTIRMNTRDFIEQVKQKKHEDEINANTFAEECNEDPIKSNLLKMYDDNGVEIDIGLNNFSDDLNEISDANVTENSDTNSTKLDSSKSVPTTQASSSKIDIYNKVTQFKNSFASPAANDKFVYNINERKEVDISIGNESLHNIMRQQGKSCTAYAAASLLTFGIEKGLNKIMVSKNVLDFFQKISIGDNGSTNLRAMHMLAIKGIELYDKHDDSVTRGKSFKPIRIDSSINTIKSIISSGLPVLLSYRVYQGCIGNDRRLKPILDKNMRTGRSIGGHSVLAVGYFENNDDCYLTYKNSHGDDWGNCGFGLVSYDYGIYDCWTSCAYLLYKGEETKYSPVIHHNRELYMLLLENSLWRYETRRELLLNRFTESVFTNAVISRNTGKKRNTFILCMSSSQDEDIQKALSRIENIPECKSRVELCTKSGISAELKELLDTEQDYWNEELFMRNKECIFSDRVSSALDDITEKFEPDVWITGDDTEELGLALVGDKLVFTTYGIPNYNSPEEAEDIMGYTFSIAGYSEVDGVRIPQITVKKIDD